MLCIRLSIRSLILLLNIISLLNTTSLVLITFAINSTQIQYMFNNQQLTRQLTYAQRSRYQSLNFSQRVLLVSANALHLYTFRQVQFSFYQVVAMLLRYAIYVKNTLYSNLYLFTQFSVQLYRYTIVLIISSYIFYSRFVSSCIVCALFLITLSKCLALLF